MLDNWEETLRFSIIIVATMMGIVCLYNIITFAIFEKKGNKINSIVEFFVFMMGSIPAGIFICFTILGGWYFDKNILSISLSINLAFGMLGIVMMVYTFIGISNLLKHKKENE